MSASDRVIAAGEPYGRRTAPRPGGSVIDLTDEPSMRCIVAGSVIRLAAPRGGFRSTRPFANSRS